MIDDKVQQFAFIIDDCFSAATQIVVAVKAGQLPAAKFQSLQHALAGGIQRWRQFKQASEVWAIWPQRPTSFGQFQEAGSCAAEVAIRFSNTVYSAIEFAKVASLSQFNVAKGDEEQFEKWATAAASELETTTLDLESWSLAAVRRDSQLIAYAIRAELAEIDAAIPITASWEENTTAGWATYFCVSPHSITTWANNFNWIKLADGFTRGRYQVNVNHVEVVAKRNAALKNNRK